MMSPNSASNAARIATGSPRFCNTVIRDGWLWLLVAHSVGLRSMVPGCGVSIRDYLTCDHEAVVRCSDTGHEYGS